MIARLLNQCYYVQVWLFKKASYVPPSAHFHRQRSLGAVTHLPNPPSVLPDSPLWSRPMVCGCDAKSYTKIFPLPVTPF